MERILIALDCRRQSTRIVDDLARASDATRHDRQSRAHRFDKAEAEALGHSVRLAVHVSSSQNAFDIIALASESDSICDSPFACRFPEAAEVERQPRHRGLRDLPSLPLGAVSHRPRCYPRLFTCSQEVGRRGEATEQPLQVGRHDQRRAVVARRSGDARQ